jgi:hypothetical protein
MHCQAGPAGWCATGALGFAAEGSRDLAWPDSLLGLGPVKAVARPCSRPLMHRSKKANSIPVGAATLMESVVERLLPPNAERKALTT